MTFNDHTEPFESLFKITTSGFTLQCGLPGTESGGRS